MRYIFVTLFRYYKRHPVIYWICLVGAFVTCGLIASQIQIEQDISKMVPHDPDIEAMNKILTETKAAEQLIFTLSFKDTSTVDPDSLIRQQQQLQLAIEQTGGPYIKSIRAVAENENEQQFIDIGLNYLPLFLTDQDYRALDSLIKPANIKERLEKSRKLLLSPAGMVASQWISRDPLGISGSVFKKLQSLHFDPSYELYDGYIFNRKQRQLNFFLELKYPASATGKNKLFFDRLDNLLANWKHDHPQFNINYFGGPAVAVGNAIQMRKDTLLTLGITLVLLLALIGYVFRRKKAPFLLMVPVVFGGIFGLAITTLVQGSISIIAIGAGAVILGIAIDFSVHFMSHAKTHPDMEDNVRALVFPLTLGAFTTIAAFYALRFGNAPVLQDLGLFAASSLLGASLCTLIFLPHLLKNATPSAHKPTPSNFIDKLAVLRPEENKYLLLTVLIATPILWYFAGQVKFDGDLMHLNYMSPELQKAQQELDKDNTFALSSMFVVAQGSTEQAAAMKMSNLTPVIERLQQQGAIRQSLDPVILLPPRSIQEARIDRWNNYWTDEKKALLVERLNTAARDEGFSEHAFDAFQHTLNRTYTPFDTATVRFLKSLMPNAYNRQGGAHLLVASLKITPGKRDIVKAAFSNQEEVIATDRQAVSEALLATLNQDFNRIFYISGALVFFTLLLAYGRIELALISFLPMAITWVWILGLMALFGLEFNFVNIIISTLIFGLGDDYSIFMMDGLLEKYRTGKNRIVASRSAVYLSVLTTIIGLGTLIFAQHPALRSIAFISVLGLLCVVFISQVIQPFLFNFLIQKRANKGFMPFTLWSLLKSSFSFFYFFTGCFLMTIVGLVLFGLKPFGKRRSKYLFHFLLSKYTGSVIYVMKNVTKKIVYPPEHVFKKPAIYIANHSSFLDILLTTMLHPKLVLLTNKWVWRSPVFGKIVRMAQYYPVADGVDDSIAPLQELVDSGYGIVVFPEGTRSYDDRIHRFHKGAFFLAEKLELDIIPILLHGVHYTMQKGDWLLKDGTITVTLKSPLQRENQAFGVGYRDRTRKISRWFREEFQKIKIEKETPPYFREQLIKSYTYKGPVLEWYCRIKIRMESYYEQFHQLLPREGSFYDLGCGYGFMSYMLHWAADGRHITGYDYDEDKIVTATNNYTQNQQKGKKNGKLEFKHGDLTNIRLDSCDGIIISDALHYLLPEQQCNLLDKCYRAIRPGGLLILRDGITDLPQRHKRTQWTERLSTRIFKFNKTANKLHFCNKTFFESWGEQYGMQPRIMDPADNTSNLVFIFTIPGSFQDRED